MRAVLAWGPVALDLDIHSVEYNKATKATCEVYYFNSLCSGSKWMVDNYNVSKKTLNCNTLLKEVFLSF